MMEFPKLRKAYIKDSIDAAELLHTHHEYCETSACPDVPGKDV